MRKFLFYFAITGWTLGLIVHLLSLTGIDVTDKVPIVWILHLGIFVVWIPATIYMNKNEEYKEYLKSGILKSMNPFTSFNIQFKQSPVWMNIIVAVGFFYAIINFFLFMNSDIGSLDIKDGQYILEYKGKLIKTLTKLEYHQYKAKQIRGFSGHWIAFYGAPAAILFPFKQKEQIDNKIQNT